VLTRQYGRPQQLAVVVPEPHLLIKTYGTLRPQVRPLSATALSYGDVNSGVYQARGSVRTTSVAAQLIQRDLQAKLATARLMRGDLRGDLRSTSTSAQLREGEVQAGLASARAMTGDVRGGLMSSSTSARLMKGEGEGNITVQCEVNGIVLPPTLDRNTINR
jgi:hypothetical protein